MNNRRPVCCNFCKTSEEETLVIVAGDGSAAICVDCIETFSEGLNQEDSEVETTPVLLH